MHFFFFSPRPFENDVENRFPLLSIPLPPIIEHLLHSPVVSSGSVRPTSSPDFLPPTPLSPPKTTQGTTIRFWVAIVAIIVRTGLQRIRDHHGRPLRAGKLMDAFWMHFGCILDAFIRTSRDNSMSRTCTPNGLNPPSVTDSIDIITGQHPR